MKTTVQTILVPTDFSNVAECAINHAIYLASILDSKISLLHIITNQKEENTATEKLSKVAQEIQSKQEVEVQTLVKTGNIFKDIGKVANQIGAHLIIMGTHGVKGSQHITGSRALKVIINSSVPFIVVQKKDCEKGYRKIVLPLDLSRETKQKIGLTIKMAKHFDSKSICIFTSCKG